MSAAIDAVVFLGNPGEEYRWTRHNAGRLLAEQFFVQFEKKFAGLFSQVLVSPVNGEGGGGNIDTARRIPFLLPETYMNLSGESAAACLSFYKIKPENCLAVHDEVELPLGSAALKWSGGLGGHNGLRSLKAHLGTADFWRLRIGVGRPSHPDIAGWVLSPFSMSERPLLQETLLECQSMLINAVLNGPVALKYVYQKELS
jgi:PTH1 family peptidyl-tRNA hydrolase